MVTIPKIKLGKFSEFLTSNEMIAVGSAVLLTPVILGTVTALISRFPVLRDNFAIGMAVAAFVIILLAGMVGAGFVRSVVLGLAAGVLLTAIQSTSTAQGLLARLGGAST